MKKNITEQQKIINEIIKWHDVCKKSYDGQHIWRSGSFSKPLTIFGFLLPIIVEVSRVDLCAACGIVKRK